MLSLACRDDRLSLRHVVQVLSMILLSRSLLTYEGSESDQVLS